MRTMALLASVVAAGGCVSGTVCDDGTFEIDGVCKNAEGTTEGAHCGPGTHFDVLLGVCVPDLPPTECDEGTTDSYVDERGVTICIGTAPIQCTIAPPCPSPEPSKVTLCGAILDLETRTRLETPDAAGGRPCDPVDPDPQGPCALRLDFYDALAFAGNPNTPPLQAAQVTVDECGYYKGIDIPRPFNGAIGIAVRGPDHVTTGVATFTKSGERIANFNAYAMRETTDQMWTQTGMPPFAPTTFAAHGVYVALYLPPTAGVQVTAGVVFVQEKPLVDDVGEPCP
jgi:hypothetical protein